MTKKIRIAIIKYIGLSPGGTEKFLQTIAAGLPKDNFEVDFYYAHPSDNPPDEGIKQNLIDNNVNLIEFQTSKPRVHRDKIWLDETNFYKVFKNNYDIIQTGRCGLFEEPFCNILNTPIVDSMHYVVGVDNQFNISRVMHISEFSRNKWLDMGGDKDRVVMVSHPMIIPEVPLKNIREELELQDKFIYGLHQRNDDAIFSPIPLLAFSKIASDNNAFILLGGGEKYKQQAKELGLNNVHFLGHTSDKSTIYGFLNSINVYAHGRRDGELNSTAIAEAMYFANPIISHVSQEFNGHVECISKAGFVLEDENQYAEKLKQLEENKEFYIKMTEKAKERFNEMYEYNAQMQNIIAIYKDIIKNPYPNPIKRAILHIKQLFPLRRHRRFK